MATSESLEPLRKLAREHGAPPNTLFRHAAAGRLPGAVDASPVGTRYRRWLIRRTDLVAYLTALAAEKRGRS